VGHGIVLHEVIVNFLLHSLKNDVLSEHSGLNLSSKSTGTLAFNAHQVIQMNIKKCMGIFRTELSL